MDPRMDLDLELQEPLQQPNQEEEWPTVELRQRLIKLDDDNNNNDNDEEAAAAAATTEDKQEQDQQWCTSTCLRMYIKTIFMCCGLMYIPHCLFGTCFGFALLNYSPNNWLERIQRRGTSSPRSRWLRRAVSVSQLPFDLIAGIYTYSLFGLTFYTGLVQSRSLVETMHYAQALFLWFGLLIVSILIVYIGLAACYLFVVMVFGQFSYTD